MSLKNKIIHINPLGTLAAAAVLGFSVSVAVRKLPLHQRLAIHAVGITTFVAVDYAIAYMQGLKEARGDSSEQWAPAPGPAPTNTKVN